MKLEDALFNWLQIKLVADARQTDSAARETERFFFDILCDDHLLKNLKVVEDDAAYHLQYEVDGTVRTQKFHRELAEKLLTDIRSEPKYNEQ